MSINQRSSKLNILVVEDSQLIVDRVVQMLSEIPCVRFVGNAGSFPQAVKSLKEWKFDIVVLDIHLVGKDAGNGIDLLMHIRKVDPGIKVIMLTNFSETHYRMLCIENGAEYFFDKSNDFEKIPRAINELAEQILG
jgi:DNA-binding NarL/FixJ family response regulator